MKKLMLVVAAISLLATQPVLAAAAPSATPDYNSNPVLSLIAKSGGKFYFMGNRHGLDGWFIVKNGQVQIAYTTPDNRGALTGALFGQDGENITTLQVSSLVANNKEISTFLEQVQKEQAAMAYGQDTPSSAAQAQNTKQQGIPSAPLSPGERLLRELAGSASLVVGSLESPELMMVMDPNCKHCHATWKMLRDRVSAGALHVRLIPINSSDKPEDDRAAAMLLQAGNLDLWDKYVGGDQSQLAGTPSASALEAVKANHAITDNWKIEMTPYLVYRAKDGKVKIVQGEPKNTAAIYADLGL